MTAGALGQPRAAVVTGSTKGLGRGLARALMQRGIPCMISGRDAGECEAVAAALSAETGTKAVGQRCDVADPDQVEALWDAAVAALGPVELWINNAGLAKGGLPLLKTDPAIFRRMVDSNIHGTFNGSRVALSGMQAAGTGGRICNIYGAGSDGKPVPTMNGYGTTKMAVTHFTRCLAAEAKESGVVICGVSPGLVITEAVYRESVGVPESFRPTRLKIMNTIADHVAVTAPWAIDLILSNQRNGAEFKRLDKKRMYWRLLRARFAPRHILSYDELWPPSTAKEQPG